ncbi:transcription factor GTE10 [Sesamum indicum]|uniref:Transcription factor GTE10 n=1 Tax=Sesamum indicum TaxID=4182 RepID=A0A6I9SUD4_SESIN|nr:transcription factor GTE10 [Sesamum indicum]XP_011073013.1 transcription factor GTE10 [Sesamum indicum]
MAPTIPIDFTGQRESKNFSISKTRLGNVMGKTRKVSKGYSTGFVPDYRHAVESVAESEGFGSSGRLGIELTASDESSALKRKCINLNVGGYDIYVPMRTFSLSKMSQSDRRDLEMRLKSELEQVRMFQRKIASLDALTLPPTNQTSSYDNGSNRHAMAESFPVSMNDVAMVPGRKKCPPGRNGPRTKGGAVAGRRTESLKQGLPQSNNFVMLMKQCEALLTRLMTHQHAWIFSEPVDIVKHKIPDYFNVIKHPMDLGTVKKKLFSGQYSSPMGFAADVRLTFKNALTYNPAGHDVHVMAEVMSKFFETRWKPIEKKIPITADEPTASKSSVIVEPESAYVPPTKKQKTASIENKVNQECGKRGMNDFEKQKLSAELEASLAELPDSIIDFLKQSTLNGSSQVSEDEIEIDIDTLNDDTLFTLRKLLDDYLLKKEKSQAKQKPSEIEVHDKSGFSNLSALNCRDHEPVDEDVDIGGDDPPPISSSIPVKVDKDATQRNSSCSSSSSSSSESGSSSSDSDSRGSDVGKNSVPVNTVNETKTPRIEQKARDGGDRNSGGESGLPDREVSPEKLYRAALLRGRFADIIIKAQENTIGKGESPDFEKLKLEKEELERRRREEKARLQAEARAAEESRRKAEEEAAAEAKRKRELEREAARQALQKMEKTVEINENNQFMEDLEMFRGAPDEHIFIEEGSPENSPNGLGSFKFPASSNPLEQLGLYMKNEEEEEEEEVEPQSVPDASNDLEGDSD